MGWGWGWHSARCHSSFTDLTPQLQALNILQIKSFAQHDDIGYCIPFPVLMAIFDDQCLQAVKSDKKFI